MTQSNCLGVFSVEVTPLLTEPGGQSDNYKENIWEIAFHFILAFLVTENLAPLIIIIIIIIIIIRAWYL